MNTIDDLRSALNYPDSPARPDASAIIARGVRRRAIRRFSAAGAAATIVAGVVAVMTLVPHATPRPAPPVRANQPVNPVQAAGVPPEAVLVAAVSRTAIDAPTRFDPMLRTLHVGTIPAGLTQQVAETGPFQQSFFASTVDGTEAIGVMILARDRPLSDLPSGQVGMPLDASSVVPRPTDPVNGRPAECLADPAEPGSCTVLRWQYAPSAWARASYAKRPGVSVADANAAVRAMAESVALTAGDRLRLPYTLSGDVAHQRVAGTLVSVGGAGQRTWRASLSLVDNDADAVAPPGVRRDLTVNLERIDPRADPGHTADQIPNTTVDGHPAWLAPDGRSLVVHYADDAVRLYLGYAERPGEAMSVYPGVHLVAAPDDLTTWFAA